MLSASWLILQTHLWGGGHRVTILSFYKTNENLPYALNENVELDFINEIPESRLLENLNTFKKFLYKHFYKPYLSFQIKRKYRDIDVIIVNDWTYTPFFKNKSTRYVKILHLNFIKYHKRNNYFDTLVLLSHKELCKYTPFHKDIKIIPNFLPTLPKEQTNHSQKIVISAGRMDEGDQKGFSRLIDIWEMVMQDTTLKDWKLHIIGQGELKKQLEEKIESKNLRDSIILKPFTKMIKDEYMKASIYAMSSHYEGFGMVLIESSAYALPCISFDIATGPSDIILDSKSGFLVEDNDLSAYATKLKDLMRDETLRENLGRNAKQRMEEKFSQQAIMPLWMELLQCSSSND